MSERTMWTTLRPVLLKNAFKVQRVENPAGPGTPDVNWFHSPTRREGWLELKWLPRWPKIGEDDLVIIEHFTREQKMWLLDRSSVGGRADLMLQVEREWMLFAGWVAANHVGSSSRRQLRELAVHHSVTGLDRIKMVEAIIRA
jgi:hypothetical protein